MTQQQKTILIVDDDIDLLEQIKLQLLPLGYNVLTAESQAQAEQLLENHQPDLALVDLMMEHTDGGFALCHHIKKKFPNTPVIIVTAVASETGLDFDAATDEERSWVKADALLAKPVRFEQLKKHVEQFLAENHA